MAQRVAVQCLRVQRLCRLDQPPEAAPHLSERPALFPPTADEPGDELQVLVWEDGAERTLDWVVVD